MQARFLVLSDPLTLTHIDHIFLEELLACVIGL